MGVPWFDFFWAAKHRMAGILTGTGWQLRTSCNGRAGTYIAVPQKVRQQKHCPTRGRFNEAAPFTSFCSCILVATASRARAR
jgi:hypothetical protein